MSRPTLLAVAVAALGAAFFFAVEGGSPSEPGSNQERMLAAAIDRHAALGKARLIQGDLSGAERELAVIDGLCRTPCTPYGELHRYIVLYRHRLASASPPVPARLSHAPRPSPTPGGNLPPDPASASAAVPWSATP